LRLIWASPEAAWSSASEVRGSEVFRFRFDDSSDLVLEGFTPEEVPSVAGDKLRFDDLIRGALIGAAEQLATATAGTFNLGPGPRELKNLSPQTSEKTRLLTVNNCIKVRS
jgi:hypothetical protein